jgi:vacuolar protein sorting-associated protein 35
MPSLTRSALGSTCEELADQCLTASECWSSQSMDEEDFEEEQNLVARLVHHLACPNSEGQYRVLLAARRHFGQGGPKRLRHTLPPLIFSGLQLVRQLHAQSSDVEGA